MEARGACLCRRLVGDIAVYWRTVTIIITPLVFLPLPLCIPTSEAACAYAIIVIAVYWITEVIPLHVTGLLPVVLFPVLGVIPAKDVAKQYVADVSFIFIGGMIMALAIEKSELHRRIALRILKLVGSRPGSVALGFMLPTWFLSMWISNTAATAMMITVVQSVVDRLKEGIVARRKKEILIKHLYSNPNADQDQEEAQTGFGGNETDDENEIVRVDNEEEKELANFSKMLCLAVAYASNIGGMATIIGTGTNILGAEIANKIYEDRGLVGRITFTSWLLYGLPHAILFFFIAWAWLLLLFFGWHRSFGYCCSKDRDKYIDGGIEETIRRENEKLGRISFAEVSTAIFLTILVILWFARDPGFMPGYALWFKKGYVSDSVPAIFITALLFVFPSRPPSWICRRDSSEPATTVPALLDWKTVTTRFPWGPFLLLGAALALANACEVSGLSKEFGKALLFLGPLPNWVAIILLITIVSFLTEVTTNLAVLALVSPILVPMAADRGVNPLYLILPAAMACSCSFMLPIATPPNTVVFAYGHLRVIDMAKAGIVLKLLFIPVIALGIHTWGAAVIDIGSVPWATNQTITTATVSPLFHLKI